MIGRYLTLDECEYEIFWHQPNPRVKAELMAKCTKSTVRTGDLPAFQISEENVLRNVRFGTWKKIENL